MQSLIIAQQITQGMAEGAFVSFQHRRCRRKQPELRLTRFHCLEQKSRPEPTTQGSALPWPSFDTGV